MLQATQALLQKLAAILSAMRAEIADGHTLNILLLSHVGTRLAESGLARQIIQLQAQLETNE